VWEAVQGFWGGNNHLGARIKSGPDRLWFQKEMPNLTRATCQCCGKSKRDNHDDGEPVGDITWGGNCIRCANLLLKENVLGISTRTGPAHRRRLRGYAKWLERESLDAMQAKP
jgi:hypothetical protein